MPAQESLPREIQRMNPPFCMTPQKAQREERSPGVDGERRGLACVLGGSFLSECSRKCSQHKEEKSCSVPSRSQCEKQVGWCLIRGDVTIKSVYMYWARYAYCSYLLSICSMCWGVPVCSPETQEIWKTNIKTNQYAFNISTITLSQNLDIFQ